MKIVSRLFLNSGGIMHPFWKHCNGLYMDGVFGNLEIKIVRDRLLFLEKSSAFDDIL